MKQKNRNPKYYNKGHFIKQATNPVTHCVTKCNKEEKEEKINHQ